MRAGLEEAAYFGKLEVFIKEFCGRLPESSRIVLANMRLAGAEALYIQGKLELFEESLEKIALEFPDLVIESRFGAGACPPGPDKAAISTLAGSVKAGAPRARSR